MRGATVAVRRGDDHLEGVLMLDLTTPVARKEALAILRPRIVLT